MNTRLLKEIQRVASRMRRQRFYRWTSCTLICGCVALLLACWLYSLGHFTQAELVKGAKLVFAASAVSCVAFAGFAWRSYRDHLTIARHIEKHHPELEHRLSTALQEIKADGFASASGSKVSYFTQRIVREATAHGTTHPWTQTVPGTRLWRGRLTSFVATLGLLAVLQWIVSQPIPSHATASQTLLSSPIAMQVQPGDTEVERGANLIVTADWSQVRMSQWPSGELELQCISEDGSEQRLAMKRNLEDPVWGGLIRSLQSTSQYRIQWIEGISTYQSPTFEARVFEYPSVQQINVSITPPSYTKLSPKEIKDTQRATAVEGSKITWTFQLNKPVKLAKLVGESGETILLQADPESPNRYLASWTLEKSERYDLQLIDAEDRQNRFPPTITCKALRNSPPTIKLIRGGDASVSALEEFSVQANIQDDFAIENAGVNYTFEDQATQELKLFSVNASKDSGKPIRQRSVSHQFNFEDFAAEPDQLLSYSLWVEDIDSNGNERRTQSDLFFADVRPFEEIFREGQPPPQSESPPSPSTKKAEELLDLQKQIMQATWNQIRKDDQSEWQQNIQTIVDSQSEASGLLEELLQDLNDQQSRSHATKALLQMNLANDSLDDAQSGDHSDRIIPAHEALAAQKLAYAGLLRLRARETKVVRSRQSQAKGQGGSQKSKRKLDDLELSDEENRYETQKQAAAASPEQESEREERQVLSRLKELAQRQQDLNEEMAKLQSAIQLAEDKEQQEELQNQLKRLREQQRELIRDADEAASRAQESAGESEAMSQVSEQLDETRKQMQKASESLDQQDATSALSNGKRAERDLESMTEELRKTTTGQFDQALKNLSQSAQQLETAQEDIAEKLERLANPSPNGPPPKGLRSGSDRKDLADQLSEQSEELNELLETVQEVVEDAEASQPLLAQKLYDSFRRTRRTQTDERLEQASELVERGFDPQARELEEAATKSIQQLSQEINEAAQSILGDQTEGLRRALNQLEKLQDAVAKEGPSQNTGQQSKADQKAGETPSENESQKPQSSNADSPGSRQESGSESGSQQQPGSSQQPGSPQKPGSPSSPSPKSLRRSSTEPGSQPGQTSSPMAGSSASANAAGQPSIAAPVTGDGFKEWSDAMRDVEEMVDDPDLRSLATQIRERVRDARSEFRRHSKAPKWALIETMIAKPLDQLSHEVSQELMRRSADKQTLVPIDRDEVPAVYIDSVRQYYERLASETSVESSGEATSVHE